MEAKTEHSRTVSLAGKAEAKTYIDAAGNVIIYQQVSDKDAARNERIRQHLLEQLQATWIQGVLENNIHEVARLELGLESQPDAMERPWVMSLERPNQPPQTLPPTSQILDAFRTLSGSMLILGEPGSGKTTTLVELARELRKVALDDYRQSVPLVFNLSSWGRERPSLIDWLTDELFLVYGVGRKQALRFLDTMSYHLLLDGLDEVSAEHRNACVAAINEFREECEPFNLVVCSRVEEYQQLAEQLQLTGAAVIQPLTLTQINAYLTAVNPRLAQLVANDSALQELVQTPLTLNIIALAYRDQTPDETFLGTLQQRRYLFTAYIDRMFERRGAAKEADKSQSINYLAWLAARMQADAQSVYYIENTQPDWLNKRKGLYSIISILVFGLGFTLYFGLSVGLSSLLFSGLEGGLLNALADGLRVGVFFGLIGGVLGGLTKIKLAETLVWSWRKWLSVMLLFGLLGVSLLVIGLKISDLMEMPGIWLSSALFWGLIYGLDKKELQLKITPNQGIRLPGRHSLKVWLGFVVYFGLVGVLAIGLNNGLSDRLSAGLFFGLFFGLVGGLRYGGSAYIKHFLLRWFLARFNYLPFNLVPFLDEMADRRLLRKVGGGYIFIHRMLLEYFASLETEEIE